MAVEAYLDRQGKPTLDTHVHESQFTVEEIEVETQAFAPDRLESGSTFPRNELETLTRLYRTQYLHQSLRHAVPLSNPLGRILLVHYALQVDIRPDRAFPPSAWRVS